MCPQEKRRVLTWSGCVAILIVTLQLIILTTNLSSINAQTADQLKFQTDKKNADLAIVEKLRPIKDGDHIMYWRPQKVGSSTMLSILMSYGYRYHFLPRRKSYSNAVCGRIANCALENQKSELTNSQVTALKKLATRSSKNSQTSRFRDQTKQEEYARRIPFKIVLTHEMCDLNAHIVQQQLSCVFDSMWAKESTNSTFKPAMREIFQVRNPIDRAISAYYFWGELYKLVKAKKKSAIKKIPTADPAPVKKGSTLVLRSRSRKNGRKRHLLSEENDISSVEESVDTMWEEEPDEEEIEEEFHRQLLTLGSVSDTSPIEGGLFVYHGNEQTPPPVSYAMNYVRDLPYMAGMPGPSFTWSAFANNINASIQRIEYHANANMLSSVEEKNRLAVVHYPSLVSSQKVDRGVLSGDAVVPLMTIVLERLEESLVVLRHHLGWSLADVVYVKQRKALSSHPKAKDWPADSIQLLRQKMNRNGEMAVYNASIQALNDRISILTSVFNVNVSEEVTQFRILRKRVSSLCLDDDHLAHYKRMMDRQGLPAHPSDNKLRDVEPKYAEQGHVYSFNREILCSFDVCGGCEAHAMLLSWEKTERKQDLETVFSLKDMPLAWRENNVDFANCPIF